jgi:hypothetical protein
MFWVFTNWGKITLSSTASLSQMLHLPMMLWILTHCNVLLWFVGAALERLSYYASVMLQTACAAFVFVCSVVRLLCAAEKRNFPLVFIASLQSPFVLCDSRALPRMCFNTMADRLSIQSIECPGILYPSSPRNWHNHMISFLASTADMYSASVVDRATSVWSFYWDRQRSHPNTEGETFLIWNVQGASILNIWALYLCHHYMF